MVVVVLVIFHNGGGGDGNCDVMMIAILVITMCHTGGDVTSSVVCYDSRDGGDNDAS